MRPVRLFHLSASSVSDWCRRSRLATLALAVAMVIGVLVPTGSAVAAEPVVEVQGKGVVADFDGATVSLTLDSVPTESPWE